MLDEWLKSERKHLARGMQKQIRKRQHGLAERQAAVLNAIGSVPLESVRTGRSADAVALEDFVLAADAMPLLDAENLHDFRKVTKKARYVAESAAEKGPYSSVAKALKRIQDAIGEWHDWQCLLEEAGTALGKDAPDLSAHLEREVERHFAAAMKTTQTMRARLSGEWMALSKPPAKRPVGSVRFATAVLHPASECCGCHKSRDENLPPSGQPSSISETACPFLDQSRPDARDRGSADCRETPTLNSPFADIEPLKKM